MHNTYFIDRLQFNTSIHSHSAGLLSLLPLMYQGTYQGMVNKRLKQAHTADISLVRILPASEGFANKSDLGGSVDAQLLLWGSENVTPTTISSAHSGSQVPVL